MIPISSQCHKPSINGSNASGRHLISDHFLEILGGGGGGILLIHFYKNCLPCTSVRRSLFQRLDIGRMDTGLVISSHPALKNAQRIKMTLHFESCHWK